LNQKLPLHRRVADRLRQRIAAGDYGNAGLPPEIDLMEEFGVSRHTMRSALQRLVNDGLIERRAGQGTRVTNRASGGVWVIGTLDDLIGEFSPDQYLTLSAEPVPARRFETVAELFGVRKSGALFHILRILTIRGLPYALANIFSSSELGGAVPSAQINAKPFIHLVEQHARVRATRARQLASASAADEQTARQLGISLGAPVLVLHRTYFDSDGKPIVHAELLVRPDRYQQIVDFAHEPQSTDRRVETDGIEVTGEGRMNSNSRGSSGSPRSARGKRPPT
jgi:GntR family transcriptional regulator